MKYKNKYQSNIKVVNVNIRELHKNGYKDLKSWI